MTNALDSSLLPRQLWLWDSALPANVAWQNLVQQIQQWLADQAVPARDAVVVLPQSAHVTLVSQAWANTIQGWMPRFETVNTLLQRLPPDLPPSDTPFVCLTLDPALDQLWVAQQLRVRQGAAWHGQDPRDAQNQVERVVGLAHAWLKLCLVLPIAQRESFAAQAEQWALAQNTSSAADNASLQIGADERRLAQWAMDWAVQSWPSLSARTSAIFEHQAAAWLMVSMGQAVLPGTESDLMRHVLTAASAKGVPVCWMPAVWQPTPQTQQPLPTLTQAKDFDQEAMQAAAWVIDRVNRKRSEGLSFPVLLVTQDRALSRRIRALLMPFEASDQLVISDESGWALPTTRAAAALTRHLQAASWQASTADVQDWLCHGWLQHGQADAAVHALTKYWYTHQIFRPWQETKAEQLPVICQALWTWLQDVRALWQVLDKQRLPLQKALQVLRQVLQGSGAWQALCDDAAGQQVLQCVRCGDIDAVDDDTALQWQAVSQSHVVDVFGLSAWVEHSLRAATFVPRGQPREADVVMTPMVRAVLRPFSAVVWPGADARQLAPPVPTRHLLGQEEEALGLATAEQLAQAQWQAFALLAAHQDVHAVYRSSVDGEPVEPSPWLKRWAIAHTGQLADVPPQGWPLQTAPSAVERIAHQAKTRSSPSVQRPLLPVTISPSGYERLRSCPYRYFVSDILGIKADQALEEGLAKNDYGTWLHEVLKRFHEANMASTQSSSVAQNLATLLALADEVAVKHGMFTPEKQAAFALRRSAIASVLAAYAEWHQTQTQAGWQTEHIEQTFSLRLEVPSDDAQQTPPVSIRLYGQLDRVDRLHREGQTQWRVIDYKTSSVSSLAGKVKTPFEDTQLAFYAALLDQWADAIEALYLSLDRGVKAVAHADVKDSAQQLLDGLRDDLTRIYQGQALPALGEGQVCDFCDARGICRKDHWAATEEGA